MRHCPEPSSETEMLTQSFCLLALCASAAGWSTVGLPTHRVATRHAEPCMKKGRRGSTPSLLTLLTVGQPISELM